MAKETACAGSPARRLWQVPLFAAGVLAFVAVAWQRPTRHDSGARQLDRDLARLRAALNERRPRADELLPLAEDAVARSEARVSRHVAEAHFLAGSLHARFAGSDVAAWRAARDHLERAEALGVSDNDIIYLLYRLGLACFHTGAEPQRVLSYLSRGIPAADNPAECFTLLTQCNLNLPTPDVRAALAANQLLLDLPTTDDDQLAPARLLRGKLLHQLGDHAEARKVLARIGSGAAPAIVADARLLRAQLFQDEGLWADAAPLWQEALNDRRVAPSEPGKVLYQLGLCHRHLERTADADRAWAAALTHGGEAAQAAALRLFELRLDGDRRAAIDLAERALKPVQKPADYRNPFIPFAEVVAILEAGCRTCREANDAEPAYRAAQLYARLAPEGTALLGEAAEAWARSLSEQADDIRQQQARDRYREAAALFDKVARRRADQYDRADWLWRAASNWLLAREPGHALPLLEDYVRLSPPPAKVGEAWYRLAQVNRTLNNPAQVVTLCLERCVAYPGPFAFRARHELALVQKGRGNYDEAINILQQSERLPGARESDVYEQTLLVLAALLMDRGKYELAAKHYEDALRWYAASAAALDARFQLAGCYRKLAEREESLNTSGLSKDAQQLHRDQQRAYLKNAVENYQKVADELASRKAKGALSAADEDRLFQARFGVAECLSNRYEFEKAAVLYRRLAEEYDRRVEGVLARQGESYCYIQQQDSASLRRALVLFKNELDRLSGKDFAGRSEGPTYQKLQSWYKDKFDSLPKMRIAPDKSVLAPSEGEPP